MLDWIIMGGALVISTVFLIFANRYQEKIQLLVKQKKNISLNYGRSILTGLVSGVIVLTLDKVITKWVTNPPSLDFSSLYNFFASLAGNILVSLFVGSFLILIIFYTIHRGLEVSVRKKESIKKSKPMDFSKIITRDKLITISASASVISLLFLFFADIQKDKADDVFKTRTELMEKMRFELGQSDYSLLLYKMSNNSDMKELKLSTDKLMKVGDDLKVLPKLYPMYERHVKIGNILKYIGLSFIVIGIIANAIALFFKK